MLKIEQIKTLENGRGLVDTFGYCYHKERTELEITRMMCFSSGAKLVR